MTGLYVHIPFCVKKCDYCDFYSLPGRADIMEAYIAAVLTEARAYSGLSFDTIYLGGGTPSLLSPGQLSSLIQGLHQVFDLSQATEFTLEANPDSLNAALLEQAQTMGVNRLSIGVQSLADAELARVGRVHTAAEAMAAINLAQNWRIDNISCDMILGLPGQDWGSIRSTLEKLIKTGIQHISAYCLTLDPHTPLGKTPPPDLPDEDAQARLYENTCRLLAQHGFVHYEISNFARPGYECRHNLNYWRGGEYLGLGPAAASHWQGRRFKNRADLDVYLQEPAGLIEETETLEADQKAAEEAMLRLRLLAEGLDIVEIERRFGRTHVAGLRQRLDALVERGLLRKQGQRYCLTPSYVLISNSILADVLED